MTTEENWNKQQELSKKTFKFIACIKGYSQKFHVFQTYYGCRIV